MSAPLSSRPLMGLAVAALVVGLIGAPQLAFASPTDTATPTATPTPTANPTPTLSAEASPSPTPTSTKSPSASASPSDPESPSDAESPSPDQEAKKGGGDVHAAIEVPGPTQSATPGSELEALAPAAPSITLTKSAEVDGVPASRTSVSKVGQVVTYSFDATNNGGVELRNVEITDELTGLGEISCEPPGEATLATGATLNCSASLTVTQAALDFGDLYNFATVVAEVPGDSEEIDYVSANAAAHVVVEQAPSIALRASVSPTGTADQGDRLRYRATATNTGNVTLTRARITSSLNALDLDCDPSARTTLASGATITCAGSYRVTAADARRGRVTNELTARAERPYGETASSRDDVTDDVRLRVAVTKPANDSDPGLADTGGPALPIGLAGLVALGAGLGLLRRSQRG